jgi:hypothetical protein
MSEIENVILEKSEKPQASDIFSKTINSENEALNTMIQFLDLAQKRGAFNIRESSKIWECIQIFMKNNNDQM